MYGDGTYLRLNPSLHEEDSDYKLTYIRELIRSLPFDRAKLRVLDIGGGTGIISRNVCRLLSEKGYVVECHALDLSPAAVAIQKINNPYITFGTCDVAEIEEIGHYELTLLIDVIEHVPDREHFATRIDRISEHIIYNIPIERNLFDWLRNIYLRFEYYRSQTLTLGHVHFFSALDAKRFVANHHRFVRAIFSNYSMHLLGSDHPEYVKQRRNRLRRTELLISALIYKGLKPVAPFLIQGSMFILASGHREKANGLN
jgi:SAM-dependent methyltransferase